MEPEGRVTTGERAAKEGEDYRFMDEKKYELTPEQRILVNHAVDRILDENKRKRKGARVFCVGCGGGQRTPLRKWRKGYICVNCWKIKETIGEDAFILRVKNNLLGE